METEKYAFMERLLEAENKNIYIINNIKQNKFIKDVQKFIYTGKAPIGLMSMSLFAIFAGFFVSNGLIELSSFAFIAGSLGASCSVIGNGYGNTLTRYAQKHYNKFFRKIDLYENDKLKTIYDKLLFADLAGHRQEAYAVIENHPKLASLSTFLFKFAQLNAEPNEKVKKIQKAYDNELDKISNKLDKIVEPALQFEQNRIVQSGKNVDLLPSNVKQSIADKLTDFTYDEKLFKD